MDFFYRMIGKKCVSVLVVIAICSGMVYAGRAEAASKPAKPSFSIVKRTKTTAKIKIKKKGKVTGYQIKIKSSKKGKYSTTPTMNRTFTFKKLKSNKVYYVKVRAYRTVRSRGTYRIKYSKYSKVLKIGKYKKPAPTPTPTVSPSPEPTLPPDESPLPEEGDDDLNSPSPIPDSND
ncbi:MAG: fibronectin type III domain-containing protein [Lachnospiraceae bacterium]|nr:fibronectin type III domain-containing protein [Lachnospiraceae bacterium]